MQGGERDRQSEERAARGRETKREMERSIWKQLHVAACQPLYSRSLFSRSKRVFLFYFRPYASACARTYIIYAAGWRWPFHGRRKRLKRPRG